MITSRTQVLTMPITLCTRIHVQINIAFNDCKNIFGQIKLYFGGCSLCDDWLLCYDKCFSICAVKKCRITLAPCSMYVVWGCAIQLTMSLSE